MTPYPGKRQERGMAKKLGRTGEELEVMEQSVSWKVKFLLGRTR